MAFCNAATRETSCLQCKRGHAVRSHTLRVMILVGLFCHTGRALLTLYAHVTRARALEYVNMPNVSVGQVTCTSSDHVCETSSHASSRPRMRTHTAAAPMLAGSSTAGYSEGVADVAQADDAAQESGLGLWFRHRV